MLSSDPEVILCNNTKMLRERLSVSGERLGEEHRVQEEDYVYDLYYQETATPGWIQDILSVRVYTDEGELVCVDGWTDRWMSAEIGVSEWSHGWISYFSSKKRGLKISAVWVIFAAVIIKADNL